MSNEDVASARGSVKANPLAMGALGVALAAFVMDCCCPYLGPVLSVIAVILAVVVIAKARSGPRADVAIGLSALVAGIVNLLAFAVIAVFYANLLAHDGEIFPVYPDGPPPMHDAATPVGTTDPLMPGLDAGSMPADAAAHVDATTPPQAPPD